MEANMFFIVVFVIGLVFAAGTCLLGIYARRKRIIKYIPAAVSGIAALSFLLKGRFFSEGMEGLGYIILMMISAIIFVMSIIAALIMEFISRRK